MMDRVRSDDDMPSPASVLAAFGVGGHAVQMVPVAGAWSNRVYRLTTDLGSFAVKELRNPWGDARWADWLDAAWRFEQLALASGVAMPAPVANPADGGCVAWVESCRGTTLRPVRMHVWVHGAAPAPGPVTDDVACWVGRTLAGLHLLNVTAADRGLFPVTSTQTADRWPEMVTAACSADVKWAGQLEEATPTVAVIADLVRSAGQRPAPEIMSHGDIDQKNLVLTADGPVLCDWDVAMPLVPRRELADVALAMGGWERLGSARMVLRAYRSAGGEVPQICPCDLGPSLMSSLDWIALHVGRVIGTHPATPAEVALGRRLVPVLLAALPREVDLSLRAGDLLAI
jgi:Ser/Thr protein kinase RdoA (MazF antagonist)